MKELPHASGAGLPAGTAQALADSQEQSEWEGIRIVEYIVWYEEHVIK
jgi:hypothetical protein